IHSKLLGKYPYWIINYLLPKSIVVQMWQHDQLFLILNRHTRHLRYFSLPTYQSSPLVNRYTDGRIKQGNGREPKRLPIESGHKKPGNKIDMEIGRNNPDNRMIVYPFRGLSSPEANSDKAHENNKGR